jgi:TolB-like protein
MKKLIVLILLAVCAGAFAQNPTLDMALSTARTYIELQMSSGNKVLIADIAAPTKELGSYITEELSTRLVNGKRLVVVERSAAVMQTLNAESAYQLSGEVSDASVQSIGQKTGAEYIITGSITGTKDPYLLRLKIIQLKTSEVKGQWSAAIQSDTLLNALLTQKAPEIKAAEVKAAEAPEWIKTPVSARAKFEQDSKGVSIYYYDRGYSNKASTRQLAETRARQNVQLNVAFNIASIIGARLDLTDFSENMVSDIEDVQRRIETAITQSIRTRVPSYEPLDFYFETGKENGKEWYIAFVLVRFARKDVIAVIDRIETDKMAENILKELNIREAKAKEEARQELVSQLKEILAETKNDITEGETDN